MKRNVSIFLTSLILGLNSVLPSFAADTVTITVKPFETSNISEVVLTKEFDGDNTITNTVKGNVNDKPYPQDDVSVQVTQVEVPDPLLIGAKQESTSSQMSLVGNESRFYTIADSYKPYGIITKRKLTSEILGADHIELGQSSPLTIALTAVNRNPLTSVINYLPATITLNSTELGDIVFTKAGNTPNYTANLTEDHWDKIIEHNLSEVTLGTTNVDLNDKFELKPGGVSITYRIETLTPQYNVNVSSKTYDGTTKANVADISVTNSSLDLEWFREKGLISLNEENASYQDPNVGTGKPVDLNDIQYPKNNLVNGQDTVPTTGDITKASVSPTIKSVKGETEISNVSITYGEEFPEVVFNNIFSTNGVTKQAGDVEVSINGSVISNLQVHEEQDAYTKISSGTSRFKINKQNVPNLSVGSNTVKIKFKGSSNIEASETSFNINVRPKEISSATFDKVSIEYTDEETIKSGVSLTVNSGDLEPTDSVNGTASLTIASENSNPGEVPSFTASSIQLDNDFYELGSSNITGQIEIVKRVITPNVLFENKEFDDTKEADINTITFDRLLTKDAGIANEGVGYTITKPPVFDNKNVGSDKTVTMEIKLTGDMLTKYEFTGNTNTIEVTGTANISRSIPDLEIVGPSEITYGETFEIKVKPNVKKKTFSLGADTVSISTEAGEQLGKTQSTDGSGYYTISLTADDKLQANLNNLTIAYGGSLNFLNHTTTHQLTVKPKPITVSASPKSAEKEYDGSTEFEVKLSTTDNINGDSLIIDNGNENKVNVSSANVEDGEQEVTIPADDIHISGDNAEYYTLKPLHQDLTVSGLKIIPNTIDLSNFSPIEKPYDRTTDATVKPNSYTIDGQNFREPVDISFTASYDTPEVGTGKQVTITPTTTNRNYTFGSTTYTTNNGIITKVNSDISGNKIVYDKTVTFGDNLNIEVQPDILVARASITDEGTGKIQLISADGQLIAEGDRTALRSKDGTYNLTTAVSDRSLFSIGDNELTVRFTGDNNLISSEEHITINVLPKPVTATYNITHTYDGTSHVSGTASIQGILPNDTVGNQSKDLPITLNINSEFNNAGDTVQVTSIAELDYNDPYYSLVKDTTNVTGTVTITKADLNPTYSFEYNLIGSKGKVIEDSIDFSNYLPNLTGTMKYGSTVYKNLSVTKTDESYFVEEPALSGSTVDVSVKGMDNMDNIGVLDVTLQSQNFNDFHIAVTLDVSTKIKPAVKIATKDLIYGGKVSDIVYNVEAFDNNTPVPGSLEILYTSTAVLDQGNYTLPVRFNPDDTKTYDSSDSYMLVRVNPRIAELKTNPKISEPVWVKGRKLSSYTFLDKGEFLGYDQNVITNSDYTLSWEYPNMEVEPGKSYTYTLTHNKTNYIYTGHLIPLDYSNGIKVPDGNSGDATVTLPPNTRPPIITDGGEIILPDGGHLDPPGIDLPPGTVINPDGSITIPPGTDGKLPEGNLVPNPDGGFDLPNGGVMNPPGLVLPPGTNTDGNGNINIPPGSTVTHPGKDNIPGTDDDIIIKPDKGKPSLTVDENGTVTLPNGGEITEGSNPPIKVPEDTTIDKDGNITIGKGEIIIPGPDGSLNTDDDLTVIPDKNGKPPVLNPDGSILLPDGGKLKPPGIDLPPGTIVKPDGSIIPPGGGLLPDGELKPNPDGGWDLPNGGIMNPPGLKLPPGTNTDGEGNFVTPDGKPVIHPGKDNILGTNDDLTILPLPGKPSFTVDTEGTVTLPNGGDISHGSNKPVRVPEDTTIDKDGNITVGKGDIILTGPDSSLGTKDDVVVSPKPGEKPIVNPDGSVTLPNGGTVVRPGQSPEKVEAKPGTTVYPDGSLSTDKNPSNPSKPNNGNNSGGSGGSGAATNKPTEPEKPNKPTEPEKPNKPAEPEKPPLNDIEDSFAKDEINQLYKDGIISGDTNGNFNPKDKIKRADFAIMIHRTLALKYDYIFDISEMKSFVDIMPEMYFYPQVMALAATDIMKGYGNGFYKPDNYITREEVSVVVSKLIDIVQKQNASDKDINFIDRDSISDWALPYVDKAIEFNILSGYPDNTFKPQNNITREEVAIIIYKLIYD